MPEITEYFSHFLTGHHNAFKVNIGPWIVYRGLVSQFHYQHHVPDVPFRLSITTKPYRSHTTCSGSVMIELPTESLPSKMELLTFTEATRLTSSSNYLYTSDPLLVFDNLDCCIEVECVSEFNAPIEHEILEPIEVVSFPSRSEGMRNPQGASSAGLTKAFDVYTYEKMKIGDQIKLWSPIHDGYIHVYVKDMSLGIDIQTEYQNEPSFRKLMCA